MTTLQKSMERGRRDPWLLLRSNAVAFVMITALAILFTCAITPFISDNAGSLIHFVLLVTFGVSLLGYWWLEKNRRFPLEIRKRVFERARELSGSAQRDWYAKTIQWLSENQLVGDRENALLWNWDVLRAIEALEPVLKRRAGGCEHLDLILYQGESEEHRQRIRNGLDAREELPSYFDTRRFTDDFYDRAMFGPFVLFSIVTLVLGISPVPRVPFATPEAREANQRVSHIGSPDDQGDRGRHAESNHVHHQPGS